MMPYGYLVNFSITLLVMVFAPLALGLFGTFGSLFALCEAGNKGGLRNTPCY
jgi:hypothetical protein